MRGYFGIGIMNGKTPENLGTLWRSAYQLGAAFIFTIGRRYRKQSSDTTKTMLYLPYYHYNDLEHFLSSRPVDCVLVGIETCGKDIILSKHPERAIYLLGAEDHGLSTDALNECQRVISLPAIRIQCFNVAVAGSLVMYDRMLKAA